MANPIDTVETIDGCNVQVLRAGAGVPVLFLHGATGLDWLPFLHDLSDRYDVIAPEHPGFGRSGTPEWLTSMGDLAFFYLDVLERLKLRDVHLVGHSLGGWLAAEIAIRNTTRLKSLTLISPAGVRAPGAEFGDLFYWSREEAIRHLYADQAYAEELLRSPPSENEVATQAKNTATSVLLAAHPLLHNPQLPCWLHRIDLPTRILWGASDVVIPAACGEIYRAAIPGARLDVFAHCGHMPMVERRSETVDAIARLIGEGAP